MAKFRILRGLHSQGGNLYAPLQLQKDGSFAPLEETKGAIIESPIDLVGRHGGRKFERVFVPDPSSQEDPAGTPLGDLTIGQLKGLAQGVGIDLGTATKKADIVRILEESGAEPSAA